MNNVISLNKNKSITYIDAIKEHLDEIPSGEGEFKVKALITIAVTDEGITMSPIVGDDLCTILGALDIAKLRLIESHRG